MTHIFLGGGGADTKQPQQLMLKFGNRHGLIAGATGTGKTVTLQVLAEGFSRAGVPVFMADVKGDLSGIAMPGSAQSPLHEKLVARAEKIGLTDFGYESFPTVFWDLAGQKGHPIRATVSEMGPLLLSRLLDLNETQEGVLNIAFRLADEEGMLLLDMKDLRAILTHIADNADSLTTRYGNVSANSVGSIQRRLLVLENQGAERFFGEPALDLQDMIRTSKDGYGQINILAADNLMNTPRLYATFLLWLLSELFENLPEVGDPEKPKFVFFFDEAHLLFDDAPKAVIDKVEQVARLIRSKGVGVYFITQKPDDVPEDILGQLGNRVQHALRAFTPRDQKLVKAAAETFRPNPAFNTAAVITEMGVGEALVSVLEGKGTPTMVERTLIRPPASRIGPLSDEERRQIISRSPLAGVYDKAIDRESAYELLSARAQAAAAAEAAAEAEPIGRSGGGYSWDDFRQDQDAGRDRQVPRRSGSTSGGGSRQSAGEAFAKSVARAVGSQVGRQLVRGLLGGLLRR